MLKACTSLDLANTFTRVSSLSNLPLCHCVSECTMRAIHRLCRLLRLEAARDEVSTIRVSGWNHVESNVSALSHLLTQMVLTVRKRERPLALDWRTPAAR